MKVVMDVVWFVVVMVCVYGFVSKLFNWLIVKIICICNCYVRNVWFFVWFLLYFEVYNCVKYYLSIDYVYFGFGYV